MGLETEVAILASQAFLECLHGRGRMLWGKSSDEPPPNPRPPATPASVPPEQHENANRVLSPFLHMLPPNPYWPSGETGEACHPVPSTLYPLLELPKHGLGTRLFLYA